MANNSIRQRPGEEVTRESTYQTDESRTLGELFRELSEDFSYLVRKEVELARTETMEKFNQAKRSIVLMVIAGLLGYAGFIALLIAVAELLYTATGVYWISALIVGVAVLIVAAILYYSGRNALNQMTVVPEKTIETLKNDAQWVKEQVQ
jgi:uncharacterized membrane protein YqjE